MILPEPMNMILLWLVMIKRKNDYHVYYLYGLTEDEITIVEGANK